MSSGHARQMLGIIGCAVGRAVVVPVAEELFASGQGCLLDASRRFAHLYEGLSLAGPTLFLRPCSGPPSHKRCGLRLNLIKLIAMRGRNGFNEYVHIKLDWGRMRTEFSFLSRFIDIASSQGADGDSKFRGEAKLGSRAIYEWFRPHF